MKPRFLSSFHVIAFVLASAHQGAADDAVWNGTTDAAWATLTNWSSDPNPVPGPGNIATFNNAGGLNDVIDLGAGVTVGSIIFDTVDVAAYTIGSGGAGIQALTLNDSGSITANSGINANQIFHANLTLGADGSAQSYAVTNSDASNSISFAGTVSGGTGGSAGAKTLNISATGGVAFNGVIADGGASSLGIVKTGGGALTLNTATHTFSGGLSIEAGTLNITGSGSANNSTISLGAAGETGSTVRIGVINSGTNPSSPITVVEQTSGTATTRVLGTNSTTSGQWRGPITMNDDLTVSTATAGSFTLNSGATVNLNSNTLNLSNTSATSAVNVVANGIISGEGNVVVSNTSTGSPTVGLVILGADNAYTGSTTISAGALHVGNGGATGSIAGTSAVFNSGALVFRRTGSLNQGGPISGTGFVRLEANGTVTFNQANTYSGSTTIGNGGTLSVATGGSIFPTTGAALNLGSSGTGTLQYDSASTSRFGTIIVGNGTNNGGTLNQTAGTITGTSLILNNSFSGTGRGTVALSGGTMTISGVSTISSTTTGNTIVSTFTISNEAVFNANNGLRLTGAPAAGRSASGRFIQDGGTVTIGGTTGLLLVQGTSTNTLTRLGQYDLNAGTVNVNTITNTSTSAADALATFNFNGGTLRPTASSTTFWEARPQTTANVRDGGAKIDTAGFDITISQPLLKFAGSTTDSLTKDGLGKLTLAGTNTYTGATTVNAGTLEVTGSLAATAVEVKNNATLAGTGTLAGSATIRTGGRQAFQVAATAGSQTARTITGSLTLEANTVIDLTAAAPPALGGPYVLLTATGGITGSVGSVTLNGLSGTVAIVGNNLELTVTAPGGFAAWAATPAFGLAPADQDPSDDPDADGMENLLEYALNGNPGSADLSILPDLDASGANFIFTFTRREESAADTTQVFEYGSNLSGWTPLNITTPTAAEVTLGTPAAGLQTVTVSISKGLATSGRLFGRLRLSKP